MEFKGGQCVSDNVGPASRFEEPPCCEMGPTFVSSNLSRRQAKKRWRNL
jgi:hypothetical protein